MAKRGRKPKPTAIKLLEGCRSDRINALEPAYTLAPGDTPPPEWLETDSPKGAEHWRELVPTLAAQGVITLADLPAMACLCDLYHRWRTYPDDLSARKEYNRLLIEFGLTPSARSRIKTTERPKDELELFLGQREGGGA